eukprot:2126824-Amphidinium_carterae.1
MKRDERLEVVELAAEEENPPGNGGHDENNDENWRPSWNRGRNYDNRWDDNQRTSATKPQALDKHKRSVPKLLIRE